MIALVYSNLPKYIPHISGHFSLSHTTSYCSKGCHDSGTHVTLGHSSSSGRNVIRTHMVNGKGKYLDHAHMGYDLRLHVLVLDANQKGV